MERVNEKNKLLKDNEMSFQDASKLNKIHATV